jgi:hypothetical protein
VEVIRFDKPSIYIRGGIVEDVGNGLVVNQYIRFNTVAVLLISSVFAALDFNNTKVCWSKLVNKNCVSISLMLRQRSRSIKIASIKINTGIP